MWNYSDGTERRYCEVCEDVRPHKRWIGSAVDFSECMCCGTSVIEHKKEELRKAVNN